MVQQAKTWIGEVLAERYCIQSCLGQRSGRRTLLAVDRLTQEQVVIKLLLFGAEFNWDDLKLFEREAQILQALSHPAIPRYLNAFELETEQGQGFALVQSYIAARSLEEELQSGQCFSESDVRQLAEEMLDILQFLHRHHPPIIHRDIKPSNILVTRPSPDTAPSIHLVDFGSVQTLAAHQGGTITVVGTYGYMPPEQFGGRSVPASDLYSLGATLIYLLTGHHPADLPQHDLRLDFAALTSASPDLIAWLQRLTEPSLDRRFTSADAALQALKTPAPLAIAPSLKERKIQLSKTPEAIDIVLPPSGFSNEVAAVCLFATLLNISAIIGVIALDVGLPSASQVISGLLYLLLIGLAGSVTVIGMAALLARTRLHIDRHQIILSRSLLGLSVRHLGDRASLHKLMLNPVQDHGRSHITLWIGTQKLEFGSALPLSELQGLAAELSEWLNMPITGE